ncbi:hypothetical protein [Dickeya dadantii]|uniref:hypothetical protein n=1 Tax=Dickeya dadantii TaxID=204038 RepID=UPI00345ACE47
MGASGETARRQKQPEVGQPTVSGTLLANYLLVSGGMVLAFVVPVQTPACWCRKVSLPAR